MLDKEAADACEADGIPSYEAEPGRVFITKECTPRSDDAVVSFDLNSFFGLKSPTVTVS